MQQPRTGQHSFLSLERKLPVLIGGLVACVLLATLFLVYIELRHSSVDSGTERLRRAAEELSDLAREGIVGRRRQIDAVAAQPAIVAFTSGDQASRAEALRYLATLRVRSDSALPLRILDARGLPLLEEGMAPGIETESPPEPPLVTADSAHFGTFHELGGRLVFWTTSPIRNGSRTVGHIAQLRSIAASNTSGRIEDLIGNQTEIYFANRDGGPWASLQGGLLANAPAVERLAEPFTWTDARGRGRRYAFAVAIPSTPWMVVTQTPWQAVVARSNDVLQRVAIIGLVLMLLGGIAAWFVSRSVTKPLRRLGEAADAIARGDYSRRTGIERDDEIGRVASSFDAMAGHVDATHAELARRYAYSQALTSELETARVEALAANSAKSDFLATMSHEIRTPINAVIGYTDLLDAGIGGELAPAQRAYVERIRLSSEHLITVVNDVLDFAKIESGQMRMMPAMHKAAATITAATGIVDSNAAARSIRVETTCLPDLRYYADETRVQQILLNLLSNALKFSPENATVRVRCDTRSSRAHEPGPAQQERLWTCITVSDTGPGVETDQLESIFEPFVQGAAGYTRPHGGTGLGLAIARSLARMMDGDITVESTPGSGASFTLWLPRQP